MAPGVFVMTDGSGVLLEKKTTVHAFDLWYCHVDGAILLIIHKCTMLPVYLPTYIYSPVFTGIHLSSQILRCVNLTVCSHNINCVNK